MTPEDAGGTRHFELTKNLVDRGHRVTVIAGDVNYLSGEKRKETSGAYVHSRITVNRVNTLAKLHAGFFARLLNFLLFMLNSFLATFKVKRPDLVFGTSPPIFQGVTAYLASRVKRVPFVLEIRDLWPAFMIEIGAVKNPIIISLSKGLEKFLYRKADIIIINSPGFYSHIEGNGVERDKIRLVPNGVDTSPFKPSDRGHSIRESMGLGDRFVILYAGAIGRSNDIGTVLDAARLIKEKEDITILLVGGGNEKEALEARAIEEGLNNVRFIPPVEKSLIPDYIAASDVGLAILKDVPMFKTTYPNKVFDYMAGGRPVLLAIDGVIREVVEAAGAGIFAQPGDPGAIATGIVKLYEDEGLREEMGMRGRKYVEEHFERREQSRELEEILVEVLAANDKG